MSERRVLLFILALAGAVCLAQVPAEAKAVKLGKIARADVKASCNKVYRAQVYGTETPGAEYGCDAHARGVITCSPQGDCQLYVSDLTPVTGTSLATILGIGPDQADAVLPANDRLLQPIPVSPKVRPIKARSATSPIVPIMPTEPDPVQSVPTSSF